MVAPASPGQMFDAALAAVSIHFGWLYPWVVAEPIFHHGAPAPDTPSTEEQQRDKALRRRMREFVEHPPQGPAAR